MGTVFSKKDVYIIGQSETKSHRSTLIHHETWLDYERGILRRLPTPHGEKSSKLKCIGCRGLVNPTNAMLIIYLLVLTDESTQCFNGNEVRVYYVLSYYRVRAPDQYILISQARFSLRLFCSTSRMTMIRCALHSPGSGRPLGYFICVV